MGILILFLIIVFGFLPFSILLKRAKVCNPIPYFFLYGSLLAVPLLYVISAYIVHSLFQGLIVTIGFLIVTILICLFKKISIQVSIKQALIFLALTMLFFFVAHKTFQYHNHTFYIASNLYADMGVHIPVIRSFSQGENLPFELPFFGGKQLTYHFFYDFLTGVLEYTGVRIDIAYNLIFSLTFASLFFVCLDVGSLIFKKRWIGAVAFLLFIFPSDLSFLSVLQKESNHLWSHNMYSINSFLGDRTMGGFLYINTYLNQRHLFFALTVSLSLIVPLWTILSQKRKKQKLSKFFLLGMLISLIPLWNVPVFLIMAYVCIALLLIFKAHPKSILVFLAANILLALPQLFLIAASSKNGIQFNPGFLVHDNLSFTNFTLLWVFNLGLAIVTIVGGFVIASRNQKKLFLILLPLFIIPNLFQITRHMFDNHKFFNFWFLYMCFYSASFLVYLFAKNKPFKLLACFLFIALIISGILNFLVVKNDVLAPIPDYSYNVSIEKVKSIVPSSKTTITNGEIFDPLSIVGRKTYLGRINDIYSFGGDPIARIYALNDLFLYSKTKKIKILSRKEDIQYIIVYKDPSIKNLKNVNRKTIDKVFKILYEDGFLTLYKI